MTESLSFPRTNQTVSTPTSSIHAIETPKSISLTDNGRPKNADEFNENDENFTKLKSPAKTAKIPSWSLATTTPLVRAVFDLMNETEDKRQLEIKDFTTKLKRKYTYETKKEES